MPAELDTKGLNCPIPILKVKKAMMRLEANDTLRVEATDPNSLQDFEAFCQNKGYALLENSENEGVFTYVIRKDA